MKKVLLFSVSLLFACLQINAQTTVSFQIAASSDDAWEKDDGEMKLSEDKLELGENGYVGLRFMSVTIPPSATITSATLELISENDEDHNPSSATVWGEANAFPTAFLSPDYNISSRVKTSASTGWTFSDWDKDLTYTSPDISALVQEIVSLGGWANGNSLVLMLEATSLKKRKAYAFEKDAYLSAKLTVTYTGGIIVSGISPGDTSNWHLAYGHIALDLDIDATNELQTLSMIGSDISISGGNTITLPAETDPKVNSSLINYVQKWDGLALVDGIIFDDGSRIGIGTSSPNAKFDVNEDILVNAIAIGKGAGNVSTNTVVGNQSLSNNSVSGFSNSAFGYRTLNLNTSGKFNTAVGTSSLTSNVTGNANTAIGNQAAASNSTGQHNVALGFQSLLNNITGNQNIGLGSFSLRVNSIGNNNIAIGHSAILNNVTGSNNTALGYEAGKNSTGFNNTFIGYQAGINETTGSFKLYIGNTLSNNSLIWGDGISNVVRVNGTLNINNAFSFPNSDGMNGQVLSTDGAGNVNWSSVSGSGTETDPIYIASAAAGISNGDVSNWNTAYNWGDHAAFGYISSFTELDPKVQITKDSYVPKWDIGTASLVDGTISMTQTTVGGNWASAIGFNTIATGNAAVAMGSNTTASGIASFAMGAFSSATQAGAIAIGNVTTASGQSSTAMGEVTLASGDFSTAMGQLTKATGIATTAMGFQAIAANQNELHNGGNIRANGTILTSDKRYKKEIRDLDNALDKVLQLQGVTYKYKDEEFKRFRADKDQLQIGFIAQDLKEILPELVSSDGTEDAYLGIRYANLTAVLVEAIKEQQKQIEELKASNVEVAGVKELKEDMKAMQEMMLQLQIENQALIKQMARFDIDLQQCCLNHQTNGITGSTNGLEDKAHLAQNIPNPFNQSTIIKYYLPKDASQAQISISDLQGNLLRVVEIYEKGYGQITIDANKLAPGTYLYELHVGNKRIDTKRMIIEK